MTLSDKRTEIQQKIGKIVRNTNISSSEKCSQIDEVIKEAVKKLKEEAIKWKFPIRIIDEIFGEELI